MPDLQMIATQPTGREVHYYRAGSGAPLLYLHGIMGLTGWEDALETLSQSFDVIAPFHPGWGPAKDQLSNVSTTLDLMVHYDDFLETLGLEQVNVAGISVGAWIGAELAAIMRRRVDKLVLINPLGIWDAANPGEDFFAQSPASPMGVQFSDPALRKSLLVEGRDAIEAMLQESLDLRATAKFFWPIPDSGVEAHLGRIGAPTLVVTSGGDKVLPAALGQRWAADIPGAQATVLPEAGHAAQLEQPAAVAELIRAWVADGAVAKPEVKTLALA
ncbi:MAG: alpha/beta hydrolase [Chloroflexi bacterium]|nr:alpha/beta hydrolase [Chloroflexota bacterium]MDA1146457.1 alpha/beta hydrolase [Chloroflexota bacterium]